MTLQNKLEGWDWIPAAASESTISSLMELNGWFLGGAVSGDVLGASINTTGVYGYGQRLQISYGFANPQSFYAVQPIGRHNSTFGFIGCGLNISGATGSAVGVQIGVFDAVNNIQLITVSFEVNGVVRVYRGSGRNGTGVLLGNSEANAYLMGVDFDVEIAFKVNSTTGEVQVKVNTGGVAGSPTNPVLHLVNVNTQPGANAYFDSIYWGWDRDSSRQLVAFGIDNWRYYDDQGTRNNTFLGTSRIQTCLTNGAGAHTAFSHSSGSTNWQAAQNQNVNDTLYVFDATVGDYDLYTFQPLVNSPTVFGVQITSFVRQDDATQRTYKNRVSSAGTISDGAAYLTSQTYTGDSDLLELDPNTGLSFTGAGVNALQGGPLVFA